MQVCFTCFFLLKLWFTAGDSSQEIMCFVCMIYFYIWTHRRNGPVATHSGCATDVLIYSFLGAPLLLLTASLKAGGILSARLSAETAFLCIPLIQEPKVIDGFNKARCNTPNKWVDAGFITNICIWGTVNRANDGWWWYSWYSCSQCVDQTHTLRTSVCVEAVVRTVMPDSCMWFSVTTLSPLNSRQSLFHKNNV